MKEREGKKGRRGKKKWRIKEFRLRDMETFRKNGEG